MSDTATDKSMSTMVTDIGARVAFLIDDLLNKTDRLTTYETTISILRRMVDAEETRCKRKGYSSSTLCTEDIRRLFNWSMCDAAKNAAIEFEAEQKRKEQEDGDSDS